MEAVTDFITITRVTQKLKAVLTENACRGPDRGGSLSVLTRSTSG
mgnify:CR=1 FL=1